MLFKELSNLTPSVSDKFSNYFFGSTLRLLTTFFFELPDSPRIAIVVFPCNFSVAIVFLFDDLVGDMKLGLELLRAACDKRLDLNWYSLPPLTL